MYYSLIALLALLVNLILNWETIRNYTFFKGERDELTGVKNKNAYKELEQSIQGNMDNGMDYLPYGLIVCDANNLKKINDTMGHAAGDEYIKACAKLLCNIFVHSPVFRVGIYQPKI